MELANHELVPGYQFRSIRYEERPVLDRKGAAVEGLHAVWISLDNERQLNSYTTEALKELILALRRAPKRLRPPAGTSSCPCWIVRTD